MMRSFLFVAALIVAAPAAWGQIQISTPGSNGGNAVGSTLTSPGPGTGGDASAPSSAPQISTPGSNGGNAVSGAFAPPSAPAPSSSASAGTQAQISTPGSNGGNSVGAAVITPASPTTSTATGGTPSTRSHQ